MDVASPSGIESLGGYAMLERYVLRWKWNWALEKEEHWLVVGELGNMLEKVPIDFGKLLQRIGAVLLN